MRDGAHAESPCIGADQGFTVGGVGLLSTPNAVHDRVGWPTMRWTITAWCQVRATPRFRLVIMGLERPLIRTPRHVPPRGASVFAQVRPRTPESCGHPLAKARSEGFRLTRPAKVRSETLPIPARLGGSADRCSTRTCCSTRMCSFFAPVQVTNPLVLVVLTQREIPWSAPLRCRSR